MRAATSSSIPVERLLAELSRQTAFPEKDGEVVTHQTHISCVFLHGEFAYKVKKAVVTPFLDYGTPERRRALCLREVRLNRRLSPEVYLGVVPVTDSATGLRFGGGGPAVDWAVKMRRLPDADMLPTRLAAGTVAVEDAERMGRLLAAFHAASPGGKLAARLARPAAVRRNLLENFRFLSGMPPEVAPPDFTALIRASSLRHLAEYEALLNTRIAEGRARDGHGDLRAQNICLAAGLQDGLQILDCIEFNSRFRFSDEACDLAYLLMDLDLLGCSALGRRVLGAYQEASGDPLPAGLVRFFRQYRACVRAKIAWMAAGESEVPVEARDEQRRIAAAAVDLAAGYAAERPRPLCVLMSGYPGSGKSSVAAELCRRLPAVHLSSDRIRRRGTPPDGRLPGETYEPDQRDSTYRRMIAEAERHLAAGANVILDATFLDPRHREWACRLSRLACIRLAVCRTAPDAIRRRLEARATQVSESDADASVYARFVADWPGLPGPGPDEGVVVDGDLAPAEAARAVLRAAIRWAE